MGERVFRVTREPVFFCGRVRMGTRGGGMLGPRCDVEVAEKSGNVRKNPLDSDWVPTAMRFATQRKPTPLHHVLY